MRNIKKGIYQKKEDCIFLECRIYISECKYKCKKNAKKEFSNEKKYIH